LVLIVSLQSILRKRRVYADYMISTSDKLVISPKDPIMVIQVSIMMNNICIDEPFTIRSIIFM